MEQENAARRSRTADMASREDVAAIILTTESHDALPVVERLGLVSAECVFGANIFKDMLAGITDAVGGRSATVQNVLHDTRRVVLDELKAEAFERGADAVVAIQFSYVELSSAGHMVLMIANGTAVKLDQG